MFHRKYSNPEGFSNIIKHAIREHEEYIISKDEFEIDADERLVRELNESKLLSGNLRRFDKYSDQT